MALYALDTDTFTLLLAGHPHVCRRAVAASNDTLAITIVSVEESLTGWYTTIRRAKSDAALVRAFAALQNVVEHARDIRILPFDERAVVRAREFRTRNRRIGTNDLRIAAIAFVNSATLVTCNTADFLKFSGLPLADWSLPDPADRN